MNEQREPIVRTFAAELEIGDGRTVVGRCVPYGETAEVTDGGPPYLEQFARGAFRGMVRSGRGDFVLLDFEHSPLVANVVGQGRTFEERDDGLHGTFRLHETPQADTALELIRSGAVTGLSVAAIPLGPGKRGPAGETIRTACHLDRVALCRRPAYVGAQITAVRSDVSHPRPTFLEELRPPRNADLDGRIAAYRARRA
jgi:HK97 family phage prohead protease